MGRWTKPGCAIGAVMVAYLVTASEAVAQNDKLAGIRTVAVVVESLTTPVAREVGLTTDELRTKVELKLRLAGLRVEPLSQSPRSWLDVRVGLLNLHPPYEDIFTFNANVTLFEAARSTRTSMFLQGELWESERMGAAGRNYAAAGVEQDVSAILDAFLNDWLAANPK